MDMVCLVSDVDDRSEQRAYLTIAVVHVMFCSIGTPSESRGLEKSKAASIRAIVNHTFASAT